VAARRHCWIRGAFQTGPWPQHPRHASHSHARRPRRRTTGGGHPEAITPAQPRDGRAGTRAARRRGGRAATLLDSGTFQTGPHPHARRSRRRTRGGAQRVMPPNPAPRNPSPGAPASRACRPRRGIPVKWARTALSLDSARETRTFRVPHVGVKKCGTFVARIMPRPGFV
jgi:hypothetical protein